jgi:hypothetical protein
MAFNEKFKYKDAFADIYDVWGRRTPSFEVHYQKEVISILSDYGHGTTKNSEDKAKVLGAGYEVLIMAFFIGLYSNKCYLLKSMRILRIQDSQYNFGEIWIQRQEEEHTPS